MKTELTETAAMIMGIMITNGGMIKLNSNAEVGFGYALEDKHDYEFEKDLEAVYLVTGLLGHKTVEKICEEDIPSWNRMGKMVDAEMVKAQESGEDLTINYLFGDDEAEQFDDSEEFDGWFGKCDEETNEYFAEPSHDLSPRDEGPSKDEVLDIVDTLGGMH